MSTLPKHKVCLMSDEFKKLDTLIFRTRAGGRAIRGSLLTDLDLDLLTIIITKKTGKW